MKNISILKWIQEWVKEQCNGNWEHENGITIETIDNPGWYITIDLVYTKLEKVEIDLVTIENAEDDWFLYFIKDKKFRASGDISKLEFLLHKFKEVAELHSNRPA